MLNSRQVLALTLLGLLFASTTAFVYFKAKQRTICPKTPGVSNIKQIATSTAIYQADYDDLFPATSAMPGTRAVLMPYVKQKEMFEELPGSNARPLFNFNVAGILASLPPYPGANQAELTDVGVFYARSLEKPGYFFMTRGDTSAKTIKAVDLQLALSYQFDRKGAKLFPPDYLADKDPLK